MKFLNKAVLFAFAFSAVSGTAFAAGADKPKAQSSPGATSGASGGASGSATGSFGDADKDRNGFVDASEASGISGLNFSSADTDADGKLSRSEFEAAMKNLGSPGSTGSSPSGSPSSPPSSSPSSPSSPPSSSPSSPSGGSPGGGYSR